MAVASKVYRSEITLPASADEVFAWHARPGAVERLTPPWAPIRPLERSTGVEEGSTVAFRVGRGPLSRRWTVRHREVRPGLGFTDEQLDGPFVRWIHEHRLEPLGPGACRLVDRVTYALPLGPLGEAIAPAFRRRLERAFAYRQATLRDDLAAHRRFPDRPALHVAVTGASGLIGSALVPFLTTGGHRVTRLVRRAAGPGEIRWDPARGVLDPAALAGVDAVVHLAGESVAAARWTEGRKRRLLESRVRGTRLVAEAIARMERPPRVLVAASAVGYYGDRGDELLSEESTAGRGFLAEVGAAWEAATAAAETRQTRVVRLRIGVVLSPAGGALRAMLPPFRLGLGGRLGGGEQWMSWVSIDDAIGAIHHALLTDALAGPVNVVAPEPVTNREFARTLARVLGRPGLTAVPATALRLVLGEMADAALLASQRVTPGRLSQTGYPFRHPTLEVALRHVLGRPAA
ncbi:MAG TPA: TIGR01777 family oxidoreductase [Gemmatimonadales bacterium]|nr:TIGR01777 family oxidoreductase [Gemmatimonadales bacterium]